MNEVIEYIILMLVGDESQVNLVQYGWTNENEKPNAIIKIYRSDFFDDGVYGTDKTKLCFPLKLLPNSDIPFFYGSDTVEVRGGYYMDRCRFDCINILYALKI